MAEQLQFTIGAEVSCTDGVCGRVVWVVVDRGAPTWVITHLVVEPTHRAGLGRFVPLGHVRSVDAGSGTIALDCTTEQFEQLDSAEVTEFLPSSGAYPGYGPAQLIARPYYTSEPHLTGDMAPATSLTVTSDAPLPDEQNDVAVHSARAHATDGDIGQVEGLVIDPRNHQVTHVLLKEGHLWGRKDVAIPLAAVKEADDEGIHLSITKQEVGDLPPVDVDRASR